MYLNLRDVNTAEDWAFVTNFRRISDEIPLRASIELVTYKTQGSLELGRQPIAHDS